MWNDMSKVHQLNIRDDITGVFDNFYLSDLLSFQEEVTKILMVTDKEKICDEKIMYDLSINLKQQLSNICHKVLIKEFHVWKQNKNTVIGNNLMYTQYETLLLSQAIRKKIFNKYPVMALLVEQTIRNFLNQVQEIFTRLYQDKSRIEKEFSFTIRYLEGIDGLDSDSHNDGRHVMILTFNDNQHLVYKPRSLSAEKTFNQFLEQINNYKLEYLLKNAKVIDCKQYGWQEYIVGTECSNQQEVKEYFYRIGSYIALFNVLQTTDLHFENIIASGAHPMFVDLETLVSVFTKNQYQQSQTVVSDFYEEMNTSVLGSMLLPQKLAGALFDIDLSGLTGGEMQSKTLTSIQIVDEGLDTIRFDKRVCTSGKGQNRVILNNELIEPTDYVHDILKGLEDCFNLLIENRALFIEKIEQSEIFYGVFRQVLRPTHVYSKYLNSIYHPDYLSDLSKVRKVLGIITESNFYKARTQLEFKELLNNDIPYFLCEANDTSLITGKGKKVEAYFHQTPKSVVLEKMQQLNHAYVKRQKYYIKLSLSMYATNNNIDFQSAILDEFNIDKGLNDSLLRFLKETVIWDETMSRCTWIVLEPDEDGMILSPIGQSFYSNAGIIWYLAVVGDLEGNVEYTNLARAALAGLNTINENNIFEDSSVSAYAGKYSAIYLYYNLGKLWNDKALIEQTYTWIKELKKIKYTSDVLIDYVNGISGMIHLLMNIYDQEKQLFIANTAEFLGNILMKHISLETNNSGLAHGMSGYALALASLWQFNKKNQYKKMIIELIKYEDLLFDKNTNNWVDRRTNESEINYWCYGASGITLARSQIQNYLKGTENQLLNDVFECGINETLNSIDSHTSNSLCHGLLGNATSLSITSEKLGNQRLKDQVKKAEQSILEKDGNGSLDKGNSSPSFMLGLAGIGYELIRLQNKKYPSALNVSLIK